ncbi:MAG: type II secretion system F family protein [Rickettsiales bacterium]|jgi:type II secretory pathway component PulF|nr:type II secretion system F family protein [Rickettsiales bacterium]
MQTAKRMEVYRKLASLLRNDFTLMDALDRIWAVESRGGKKPDEPFAIVLRSWQGNLERGQSFPDAVRAWVPINETLMLSVGDVSRLSVALENVTRVGEGIAKIKAAMRDAVMYPLFLFALTFIIIIAVGIYLVPPLAEAAGGDMAWRGVAASLIAVSDFSNLYWPLVLLGFAGFALIVWYSFANWSGRVRVLFDNLPPWSMYKISVSASWMMSLAAMVAAGGSLPVAIKTLADNSGKYLRNILEKTNKFITNGDNLGRALQNTGARFPNDDIIGDLAIYADMTGFDQNLSKIASDYLDQSVRRMESLSSFMNSFGIILVSAVIAWVVFGTFEMQDQITAALS